jgi:hypothetical protein
MQKPCITGMYSYKYMKVMRIIFRGITRKLTAGILGACLVAGLGGGWAVPAHADVYCGFNCSTGKQAGIYADYLNYSGGFTPFWVSTHIQDRGWINAMGTTGEAHRLEAIRVTQSGELNLYLRPYVSNIGWMATQCTNGSGNTITDTTPFPSTRTGVHPCPHPPLT